MNIIFTIQEVTTRRNGYNMPVVVVQSSGNVEVINRGYNEFEALQEIDETDLLRLRELLPGERIAHLEIITPARKTNAWYNIKSQNIGGPQARDIKNIVW